LSWKKGELEEFNSSQDQPVISCEESFVICHLVFVVDLLGRFRNFCSQIQKRYLRSALTNLEIAFNIQQAIDIRLEDEDLF